MLIVRHLKTGNTFEVKKEKTNLYAGFILDENMQRIKDGINSNREISYKTRILKKDNCKIVSNKKRNGYIAWKQ